MGPPQNLFFHTVTLKLKTNSNKQCVNIIPMSVESKNITIVNEILLNVVLPI